MLPRLLWLLFAAGLVAAGHPAGATDFRRELSTDRPDTTESPYTVEAGRWQMEMEPLRWSRDHANGLEVEALALGAINLKRGLNRHSDLQLVFEPWIRVDERAGTLRRTIDGHGETTLRLKINLAGNDEDGVALAVMPWVKLVSASEGLGTDHTEGGVIVPVAVPLTGDWGLGLMAEFDAVYDDDDDATKLAVVTTATVAGPLAPDLGFFLELASEARSTGTAAWAVSFNAGITWALSGNMQLDAGSNVGLTETAEDLALFAGISTRW